MLRLFFSILALGCDLSMTTTKIQLTFCHGFKTAAKKLGFEIELDTECSPSNLVALWTIQAQLSIKFYPTKNAPQQNDIHMRMKLSPTDFTSWYS